MKSHKHCSKCKQDLPVARFSKNAAKKTGLQDWCSACQVAQVDSTSANQDPQVYVMTCIPTGEQYVGSTTTSLEKRFWCHRTQMRRGIATSLLYRCMRCWSQARYWKTETLEQFGRGTISKQELRDREQVWMDRINPFLNTVNAVRGVA